MKKLLVPMVLFAATAHGEIYSWTDSQGTSHYTNNLYEVPSRYQKRMKVLDLGLGQKQDPVPPQQGAPAVQQSPQPAPLTTVRQEGAGEGRGHRDARRASRRSREPRGEEE